MRKLIPLLAFLLALATGLLLLTGASVSTLDGWLANPGHRLPNVRLIEDRCRPSIVARFIALQDWSRPTLLLLGDSQVFSGSVDDEATWGSLVGQQMNLTPVNISILDGRPSDTAYVARMLHAAGVRSDAAIVDLNQSHFSNTARGDRRLPEADSSALSYWWCAYTLRRFAMGGTPPELPGDGDTHTTFAGGPLAKEYYQFDAATAEAIVTPMLIDVARLSDRPIAYVAPNNTSRFQHYGFDPAHYQSVSQALLALCESAPAFACLDMADQLPGDAFADIVHFTTSGSSLFADKLLINIELGRDGQGQ